MPVNMANRIEVGNVLPMFSDCEHLGSTVENVSQELNIETSARHRKNQDPVQPIEPNYEFSKSLKFSVKVQE